MIAFIASFSTSRSPLSAFGMFVRMKALQQKGFDARQPQHVCHRLGAADQFHDAPLQQLDGFNEFAHQLLGFLMLELRARDMRPPTKPSPACDGSVSARPRQRASPAARGDRLIASAS